MEIRYPYGYTRYTSINKLITYETEVVDLDAECRSVIESDHAKSIRLPKFRPQLRNTNYADSTRDEILTQEYSFLDVNKGFHHISQLTTTCWSTKINQTCETLDATRRMTRAMSCPSSFESNEQISSPR